MIAITRWAKLSGVSKSFPPVNIFSRRAKAIFFLLVEKIIKPAYLLIHPSVYFALITALRPE